ncbi:MAG: Uma2 family endonuclease [Aggregatilineales bacterium]
MAVQTHVRVSVEEFEKIVALPENVDRRLEFIGGEIVEVVSNNFASQIAALILVEIGSYNKQHDLGYITSAEGGYKVSGEDYMPDIGFISKARQPKRSHDTWNPLAPDLAVEVVSPTDRASKIAIKVANYLNAGTLLWYFYPDEQEINVYEPGQPVKTLGINDTLDGGKVLPGFKLALKDIFPSE